MPVATSPPSATALLRSARRRVLRSLTRAVPFLEDELLVLSGLVPPGGTTVDVGANRGVYMTWLSLLVGDRGSVVALEPQPGPLRTARLLRRALRLDNVTLLQRGLGDTEARLQLVVPYRWGLPVYGRAFLGDAPDLAQVDLAEFHSSRRRDIRVTTLDNLTADLGLDSVDFIKCDIEGAELRMLQGASRTIARDRPILLLEIEDRHVSKYGHRADDVVAWLAERGYVAHVLDPRAPGDLVEVGRVTEANRNYLFLPS